MRDESGRTLLWGWVREARSLPAGQGGGALQAGWAGILTLPRVLSLRADGLLGVEPAPEVALLRREHRRFTDLDLAPAAGYPLPHVQGDSLEIIAQFDMHHAEVCGLKVRCAPGGEEETVISYSRSARAEHRSRSSLAVDAMVGRHSGPLALGEHEPLILRVFLDRSVTEVYVNGRACMTARIYPTGAASLGVELFAWRGHARVRSIDVWTLATV
jgi:beta-fructofuranosidase